MLFGTIAVIQENVAFPQILHLFITKSRWSDLCFICCLAEMFVFVRPIFMSCTCPLFQFCESERCNFEESVEI